MDVREVGEDERAAYDEVVGHVTQSWEWGECRDKQGVPRLRFGIYRGGRLVDAFCLTLHRLPFVPLYVGYVPKGPFPDEAMAGALTRIGGQRRCIAIRLVPSAKTSEAADRAIDPRFRVSPRCLFLKHSYVLDLTKSEDELWRSAKSCFRQNVRGGQRRGLFVEECTDDRAFDEFYKLYAATCERQGYAGHDRRYHEVAWRTMRDAEMARILLARYRPVGSVEPECLAAWMLYDFKDTLYYPYGGSSDEYRNLRASDLVAWEAIRLGKRLGLRRFDLWGALPPGSSPSHPHHGFSQFKAKLGADLVEYLGTYDLVLSRPLYALFAAVDTLTALKRLLLGLAACR